MQVTVNGVRLFFDVEGAKFVADGPAMREKPTLLLLHGGPERRAVNRPEVLHWFTRPGGEAHSFDMLGDLHRIQCPTLVLGGEDDPMLPIECQADIAAALPQHLVQFERFADCGHAVVPDAPERAMAMIRDFIERQ